MKDSYIEINIIKVNIRRFAAIKAFTGRLSNLGHKDKSWEEVFHISRDGHIIQRKIGEVQAKNICWLSNNARNILGGEVIDVESMSSIEGKYCIGLLDIIDGSR